jgi:hypothetical protein
MTLLLRRFPWYPEFSVALLPMNLMPSELYEGRKDLFAHLCFSQGLAKRLACGGDQ